MKKSNLFLLLLVVLTQTLMAQQISSKEKLDWKLGAQAYTFKNFTFAEALDKISSIDLKYVEAYPGQKIGGGIEGTMHYSMDAQTQEKVKNLLSKNGVELIAYGVVSGKDEEDWRKILKFANEMGIKYINSEPDPAQLDMVNRLAGEYNIIVALHNHPKPSVNHPKPSAYWNPDFVLESVKNRENLKVCADVGHWVRSGLDPVKSLQKLEGHIATLHFKDLNEKSSDAYDVPWGSGISNVKAMLQELKRQNFEGIFSIEYEHNWNNSLPEVKQSAEYFRKISVKEEVNITDSEVLNFNYTIGTQTVGPSYGFTQEDRLVESSRAILDMGSNILKISLNTSKYSDIEQNPQATAVELARDHPSFKKVLDMPFTYYFFWANNSENWKDGYSDAERRSDSTQIADLTTHLLTKYNNSGKQFFLGNWEGDWMLLGSGNVNRIPTDEEIQGMIQWYECRQNAMEEAIRTTEHENVNVFSYSEVNRVVDAMEGKPRVVNKVLPYTNVDYVSYSAYDAQKLPQSEYNAVLDFIETNLPAKPQIEGKRVFIGEMGIKANAFNFSKSRHMSVNRANISKALKWGAPFVLYWEMYNNEIQDGIQEGLWLIDDKNVKWPLYYLFSNFYKDAKIWVATQKEELNRLPTREEYLNWAIPRFENPY